MKWARDFYALASWYPAHAVAVVMFSFSAAALEGLGLSALVPVLTSAVGGAEPQAGPMLPGFVLSGDRSIAWGIALFIALAGLASLSRFAADFFALRLRTSIEATARERMGRALLGMSWPAFLSMRIGDIAKAQVMEGYQIGIGTQLFVQALGALLACVAYFVVALSISVPMTLYTMAFGGIVVALYAFVGRWARRHVDALSHIVSTIGERLTEVFQGLKLIRATGLSHHARAQASVLYESWRSSYVASQMYSIGMRQGFELLGLVFMGVFLFVSLRTGAGIGLPSALVFLAVFYRLAPRLLAVQDGLYQARTYHSWYVTWQDRLARAEQAIEVPSGRITPDRHCLVQLHSVTYQYPDAPGPAIEAVSLSIPPGGAIAVMGSSGSGKTTLLDLLTGLVRPTEGSITLNRTDLCEIDLQQWRQRIGIVQQDPLLLHGTILDNICWGDAAPDVDEARRAAEAAHAASFIDQLPRGINTLVGERGGRLSGGQRQRIALARALYRQPDLLILDEPTSALDPASEQEVLASLLSIKGRCSMLLVTHSPEVAAICDSIFTLNSGRTRVHGPPPAPTLEKSVDKRR